MLEKLHNAGQGCKVTHVDRILRERAGRETGVNWLLWIFLRWRLRGNKNMCAHTVILTPLYLPDLRVMEVRCVILMNKNHADTLLVKMREEKYILLLFTFHETVCKKQREAKTETDWVSAQLAFN